MKARISLGLALLDALCVLAGLCTAWAFWLWMSPNLQSMLQIGILDLLRPNPWMPAGGVCILVWVGAINRLGLHDPAGMENSVHIASSLWRSVLYVTVVILVVNFLVGVRVYPKSLITAFLLSSWAILTVSRLLIFRLLLYLPAPPTALSAIVIGAGIDGQQMAERMARHARHACLLVGHVRTLAEQNHLHGPGAGGAPGDPGVVPPSAILGDLSDLPALVNRHDVRILLLAARNLERSEAMRLAVQADRMGIRVLQAPYSWGVVSPRLGFSRLGGLELIDLVGIRYPTLAEQFKRAFDLVAVIAGGLLILPLLLAIAAAIKLQDGGPVLYLSRRVGRGGRTFFFYKFRSMVVNADALRATLAQQNEADGRLFKMRQDPRITPFGHFIRKYSIDEFPQLLNVLRGDMNLVGPRPLPDGDLQNIDSDPEMAYWFEQRHKVNPGITGLWQVSGRSNLGFADMVRLDIQYIQDWNVWLDLQILLKTVPAVLKGRGAM